MAGSFTVPISTRTLTEFKKSFIGFDLLKCVNTCGRVPDVPESGHGSLHGNGLKIIRRVSKKYGGDAVWKYDAAGGELGPVYTHMGQRE